MHSAQNEKHKLILKEKTAFFIKNMMEKAVFSVEIFGDFHFIMRFLAALSTSAVRLYGYVVEITSSASV